MIWDEEEIRALAARLLAGSGEEADEELLAAEPQLAAELAERLAACGVRLWRAPGQAPLALIEDGEELPRLPRAALAHCALRLHPQAEGSERRVKVADLAELLGYAESYVRRAVLGPLERRGLVRVVKPDQRAEGAYVVAGPLLAAVDLAALRARLGEG